MKSAARRLIQEAPVVVKVGGDEQMFGAKQQAPHGVSGD
jgi:hypothetical protein